MTGPLTKAFYEWEDVTHVSDSVPVHPWLDRYYEHRLYTIAAVEKEWREYLKTFPPNERQRKIVVFRISYEVVSDERQTFARKTKRGKIK